MFNVDQDPLEKSKAQIKFEKHQKIMSDPNISFFSRLNDEWSLFKDDITDFKTRYEDYVLTYSFAAAFVYTFLVFLFGYRKTYEKSLYMAVSLLFVILLVKFGLTEFSLYNKVISGKYPIIELFSIFSVWLLFNVFGSLVKKIFPETTSPKKQKEQDIERVIILMFIYICFFFLFKFIVINRVFKNDNNSQNSMLNLVFFLIMPLTLFLTDFVVYKKFIFIKV